MADQVRLDKVGDLITALTTEHVTAFMSADGESGHATVMKIIEAMLTYIGAPVLLKGDWDASEGTFPGGGEAKSGWSYIVTTGGTVDGVEFNANDRLIAKTNDASSTTFEGNWFKADYTDQVLSVAGLTGAIGAAALRTALELAAVASSGSYEDLFGKPALGNAAGKNVGTTAGTVAAGDDERIVGAAQADDLKPVATSGSYNDLTDKPSTVSGAPNAVIEDQKSSGTAGGTFTNGAWQKRGLNTEVRDPDNLISITSDEFTPTVDGWVEWTAPAYLVGLHQTRLYNVTDSVVAGYGSNASISSNFNVSESDGGCAVAAGKTYRLEHRSATSQNTNGFGRATGFGGPEVYSRVKFWSL